MSKASEIKEFLDEFFKHYQPVPVENIQQDHYWETGKLMPNWQAWIIAKTDRFSFVIGFAVCLIKGHDLEEIGFDFEGGFDLGCKRCGYTYHGRF